MQGLLFSQETVGNLLVPRTQSPFKGAEGALQFCVPYDLHPGTLAKGNEGIKKRKTYGHRQRNWNQVGFSDATAKAQPGWLSTAWERGFGWVFVDK